MKKPLNLAVTLFTALTILLGRAQAQQTPVSSNQRPSPAASSQAPAATPKDIVSKIYIDTSKVLKETDLRKKIGDLGADVVGNSPEEFGAAMRAESAQWAEVIKAANIKIED